jgi:hypothetical protein
MKRVTVDAKTDSAAESKSRRTKRNALPHYPELPVSPEMSAAQKRTAEYYNTMRRRLIELGEMESK